jgi:hypothetical protein
MIGKKRYTAMRKPGVRCMAVDLLPSARREEFSHAVVWAAGRVYDVEFDFDIPSWELLGIYRTKECAAQRCSCENDFVGPIVLDDDLPERTTEWPGILWYPFADRKCANCRFWGDDKFDEKECLPRRSCTAIRDLWPLPMTLWPSRHVTDETRAFVFCTDAYAASSLYTSGDFGCVLWEEREADDAQKWLDWGQARTTLQSEAY